MRTKIVNGAGGLGEHIFLTGKNAEASATIKKGQPAILALNGTDDGFAVVLPSTAGAAKSNAFYFGVSVEPVPSGTPVGVNADYQAYGYIPYVIVSVVTRASTATTFPSYTSYAEGAVLTIDTVNNCFAPAAATDATNVYAYAVLVDSLASGASSDSATSDTRTVITTSARAFLRML